MGEWWMLDRCVQCMQCSSILSNRLLIPSPRFFDHDTTHPLPRTLSLSLIAVHLTIVPLRRQIPAVVMFISLPTALTDPPLLASDITHPQTPPSCKRCVVARGYMARSQMTRNKD